MSDRNVINMSHPDTDTEAAPPTGSGKGRKKATTTSNQTEAVIAAVRGEFRQSKADIVEEVKKDVLPAIEAAVKRAMGQSSSQDKKRQKRHLHEFKIKGNQKRYHSNEEVIEKIEEAIAAVDSQELEEAKAALNSGMKLMLYQQKLIKIADREEHGWDVVRYYVSDDLADDTDDEKNLNRARREALASIKKRKQDKFDKARANVEASLTPSAPSGQGQEYGIRSGRRYPNAGGASGSDSKICYICGRRGHLQYVCPDRYGKN